MNQITVAKMQFDAVEATLAGANGGRGERGHDLLDLVAGHGDGHKPPGARNRGGRPRRLAVVRGPVVAAVPQLREQLHAVFVHRRGYLAKAGDDVIVPSEQRVVDAGAVHAGDFEGGETYTRAGAGFVIGDQVVADGPLAIVGTMPRAQDAIL